MFAIYCAKAANKENSSVEISQSSQSHSTASSKRSRTQENNRDKQLEEAVNTLSDICKENSSEFDKFGESVAAQLKQFSLEEAVQMQLAYHP